MVRRLKIYFIHSSKYDYNNLLYRYVLSSSICLPHELILPLSKNYQNRYVKDLINEADIIIAEVSTPSWSLKLELKWALKAGKIIKFISLNNLIPAKFKKLVPNIEQITEEKPMLKIIEDFVLEYANMSKQEQNNPTMVLGEL